MERSILESIAIQEGLVMSEEPILSPARQAWRRWRELEPYEYRLPVPRRVLFAACGYAVLPSEWLWLLYLTVGWHHWLRPGETLGLEWGRHYFALG